MKRIFVIIGILSLLVLGLFGYKKYTHSNIKLDIVKLKEDKVKKVLAVMVEQANGTYQESNTFPTGNYVFSEDKSGCIDKNGKTIANSISYSNRKVTFRTNGSAYCYVYFDIPPTLADIIVDLTGQTVGNGTVINANGYRYSGSDPDNYITFNNETWRIIGLVDSYVKIIRNDLLGYFTWDYKGTGVGSATGWNGSNDWTDSQLMMMLNPVEYLKEGYRISNNMVYDPNGNLVYQNMGSYYNRTSGYRPAYMAAGATSYNTIAFTEGSEETTSSIDFSSTGLNATARNLVQENIWYLSSPFGGERTPSEYYRYERNGQNTYGENPITWRGKVGLMYISDYFYANNNLYSNPNTYDFSDGCIDNWLCVLDDEYYEWEWTLAQDFTESGFVDDVDGDGNDGGDYAYIASVVRPVVYLKSGINVTGTGDINSKYQIVS